MGNLKCILLSQRNQPERLHPALFQLCDIYEKAQLWRQQKDQWLPGLAVGRGKGIKTRSTGGFRAVKRLCTTP